MDQTFSLIDLSIVAVYFVLVLAIGFYFRKRSGNSEEYFLAGRNVGWLAIGASLFATNISSEHFLGLAGTGSKSGLAALLPLASSVSSMAMSSASSHVQPSSG